MVTVGLEKRTHGHPGPTNRGHMVTLVLEKKTHGHCRPGEDIVSPWFYKQRTHGHPTPGKEDIQPSWVWKRGHRVTLVLKKRTQVHLDHEVPKI